MHYNRGVWHNIANTRLHMKVTLGRPTSRARFKTRSFQELVRLSATCLLRRQRIVLLSLVIVLVTGYLSDMVVGENREF